MTDDAPAPLRQEAPYPTELADLVSKLRYREGWSFSLVNRDRGQGSRGLTLAVRIECRDTYRPELPMRVYHYMIVPAAAYDRRSWQEWLFRQVLLVEQHECQEFFQIGDRRPYAPHHYPGADPYAVRETTDAERRLTYKGEVDDTI